MRNPSGRIAYCRISRYPGETRMPDLSALSFHTPAIFGCATAAGACANADAAIRSMDANAAGTFISSDRLAEISTAENAEDAEYETNLARCAGYDRRGADRCARRRARARHAARRRERRFVPQVAPDNPGDEKGTRRNGSLHR